MIHAAGIAGGGIIQLKTPEMASRVFAPKLRGALVLDAIFKDVKLDFLVLCSSLSSILGGAGQVDYCAANAFLDAFAHRFTSNTGTFAVAINWPTWQEVGMAVNTMVPPDLKEGREEALRQGILSKEGVDAFSRILNCTLSQVVVSTARFTGMDGAERRCQRRPSAAKIGERAAIPAKTSATTLRDCLCRPS